MPGTPTSPPRFTPEDKVDWEVRKLQAETEAATRSAGQKGPARWIPWTTALVAVGGFFLQYQDAQGRRRLDAVHLEEAQLEKARVVHDTQQQIDQANATLEKAKRDLEDTLKKRQEVAADTDAAVKDLKTARESFDHAASTGAPTSAPTRDLRMATEKLDRSLQTQRALNEQSRAHIESLKPIDTSKLRAYEQSAPNAQRD